MKKLLIANRGEIAVRVIRAAREMGIRTVAVYSEADAKALHTRLADEAVAIGEPEPAKSYLSIETILEAARVTGADAIHPGYGFLSERAEFAERCEGAGLRFVGPSAAAMRRLGAKIDAKQLAVEQGVPITPGFFEADASVEAIQAAADRIGYPVMLKASAGGGGRGMRVVREPEALASEFRLASEEALKAFGDGAMMVEKLIERPRHVEVQVLADAHGTVACLFERECSVQRRHQKLIEEAPAPAMERHPALWEAMREAASKLVRASGYVGAGTVEFMVDPATGEFYFLEVNARLQVEHPVTECVTGLDLVQWQLRIAQGERLSLPEGLLQGDRERLCGHAIEVRVIAEDPAKGFLPSVGPILAWAEPKTPGVRVDTGYEAGSEVTPYYDSMLAKVIAHGETRQDALRRLRSALLDFHALGVKTNVPYLLEVLDHEDFRSGEIDTAFLGRAFEGWAPAETVPPELGSLALLATEARPGASGGAEGRPPGVWDETASFRNLRAEPV